MNTARTLGISYESVKNSLQIRSRFVVKPRIHEWDKNTYECLRIYYDSATMPKNALRMCYELTTIFGIGNGQNFEQLLIRGIRDLCGIGGAL